jgi:hypothetical protein
VIRGRTVGEIEPGEKEYTHIESRQISMKGGYGRTGGPAGNKHWDGGLAFAHRNQFRPQFWRDIARICPKGTEVEFFMKKATRVGFNLSISKLLSGVQLFMKKATRVG